MGGGTGIVEQQPIGCGLLPSAQGYRGTDPDSLDYKRPGTGTSLMRETQLDRLIVQQLRGQGPSAETDRGTGPDILLL